MIVLVWIGAIACLVAGSFLALFIVGGLVMAPLALLGGVTAGIIRLFEKRPARKAWEL